MYRFLATRVRGCAGLAWCATIGIPMARGTDRWRLPPRPSQVVLLVSLALAIYGGIRLSVGLVAIGLFVALVAAMFGRMRGGFELGGGNVGGTELPTVKGELD